MLVVIVVVVLYVFCYIVITTNSPKSTTLATRMATFGQVGAFREGQEESVETVC